MYQAFDFTSTLCYEHSKITIKFKILQKGFILQIPFDIKETTENNKEHFEKSSTQ